MSFSTVLTERTVPVSVPGKRFPTVPVLRSVPGKRFRRFRFPVPVRFLGHPGYVEFASKQLQIQYLKRQDYRRHLTKLIFWGANNRKRAEYSFGEYGFKHRTQ